MMWVVLVGVQVCSAQQQVRVALGQGPDEMVVSWASEVNRSETVAVRFEEDDWREFGADRVVVYSERGYTSPYLYHATIRGLEGARNYAYRVADGPERAFRTPRTSYPVRVAFLGDMGQTDFSKATATALRKDREIDVALLVGDISYADSDGRRWDSWGAMAEATFGELPLMVLPGNHEIEIDRDGEPFKAYRARFMMPEAAPERVSRGSVGLGVDANLEYDYGSSFYSFEAGPLKVIALNTYASGPRQRTWLEEELNCTDRERTPWVVVGMHAPWYSSNLRHRDDVSTRRHRAELEDVLTRYGVPVVFAGHVHAYERTFPACFGLRSDDGPVYVTLGDAGVRENLYADEKYEEPSFPSSAAPWSAYRNGSTFGYGTLEILDADTAVWRWLPLNQQGIEGDTLTINNTFGTSACCENCSVQFGCLVLEENEDRAAAAAADLRTRRNAVAFLLLFLIIIMGLLLLFLLLLLEWRRRRSSPYIHTFKTLLSECPVLKEEEEEGEFSEDERYEVTKINSVRENLHSRPQARVIVLAKDGFRHQKGDAVRKIHRYHDVASTYLQSSSRVSVTFFNDSSDLVYETPLAPVISQRLLARIGAAAKKPLVARPSSRRARKLEELTGETEARRIAVALAQAVLSPTATEARAIRGFLDRQKRNPNPKEMREFADGLREYAMRERFDEFSKLVVDSRIEDDTFGSPSVEASLAELIEDTVFSPLLPLRFELDEAPFKAQRQRLRNVSRRDFGVPAGLCDCEFRCAIAAMSTLDQARLPTAQLRVLLNASKAVHHEHERRLGDDAATPKPPPVLTADDLLPILIYVFVHADLETPLATRATLWALADPRWLRGEPGYNLTMFHAAIEYVQSDAHFKISSQDDDDNDSSSSPFNSRLSDYDTT
ncbi:hypothetical protein CTAYLR_004611 [Chrysophaeum taylorii]|uniref:Purple acid phosphatase n=1 Tax=Chrysophaeum taylorii TaxID=2483200 RepID=A0AAD7UEZ8_9STRA|nr:hypothetical protein CTAYLR_004611 [Chrysophaeum taylorii]